MLTIGVDPHKQTHSAVAVDELGVQRASRTEPARREGFGELLAWSRGLAGERVWVIEDCRHVSGPFERFLLDHGETVVRLPPRLMADARRGVRERGKSDPIDALAVARAALREGLDTLPAGRLAGPELEIRLLVVHRERLVDTRARLTNELRWQLHDLWPEYRIPKRALIGPSWQVKVARRPMQTSTVAPRPSPPAGACFGDRDSGASVVLRSAVARSARRRLAGSCRSVGWCRFAQPLDAAVQRVAQCLLSGVVA
jgi:transposase